MTKGRVEVITSVERRRRIPPPSTAFLHRFISPSLM